MAIRNIFCPNCGKTLQVNDEKEFCFCLECGTKINIHNNVSGESDYPLVNANSNAIDIDEKLKEVAFYYQLSQEKNEAEKKDKEPIYYLKAQDLLIDLSQQFANDYRVWWELCKPIDYISISLGGYCDLDYSLNEKYFNKALDLANLDQKKEIIVKHDIYVNNKQEMVSQKDKKQKEMEKERQRQLALQKQKEEEQRLALQQKEAERQLVIQQKNEEEKKRTEEKERELLQLGIAQSTSLWNSLASKDYSLVDNSYFQFQSEQQRIIGIFKVVSNILYLMSFRIDTSKNNAVIRDQTINVKFDSNGIVTKFDNRPVRVKGFIPPNDMLCITFNGQGGLCVANMPLVQDMNYAANIMRSSKKPLLAMNKIFM